MSSPHISLPTPSSTPVFGAPPPKKRKKNKASKDKGESKTDFNRALDEGDDVSDGELVEAPLRRRVVDDDYDVDERGGGDDEGEGEDAEEGEVEDGDGDGDGEGTDAGRRVSSGPSAPSRELGTGEVSDEVVKKRDKKAKGERLQLRSLLDEEQAKRFDAFSTAVIPKQAVNRLNREIYDQRVNSNLTALLAGMAKIFVADMVELAKDIQPDTPHPTGPLRPYHLRLARAMMAEQGVLEEVPKPPAGASRKRLFKPT